MCNSCDVWAEEIQQQEQPSSEDSELDNLDGEAISRPEKPVKVSAVPLK